MEVVLDDVISICMLPVIQKDQLLCIEGIAMEARMVQDMDVVIDGLVVDHDVDRNAIVVDDYYYYCIRIKI